MDESNRQDGGHSKFGKHKNREGSAQEVFCAKPS
jgi:hypothetical protein